jgi:hypothetical protein
MKMCYLLVVTPCSPLLVHRGSEKHIVAHFLKARTVEPEKQLLFASGSESTFVSTQRLGKHVDTATDTHITIEVLLETAFSTLSVQRGYEDFENWSYPCGGGLEYLHRDPASRRRRRKGKSRIWDSKIWPRVPRDSDLRMTALGRASSNCKGQTRPLVREGIPNQQTRNCLTVIKIWS